MNWDGKTTDGLDIPSGTYYYTIELTDALGSENQSDWTNNYNKIKS